LLESNPEICSISSIPFGLEEDEAT
jgi:hypothetical protein